MNVSCVIVLALYPAHLHVTMQLGLSLHPLGCRALVGSLFFRHCLVSTPSTPLGPCRALSVWLGSVLSQSPESFTEFTRLLPLHYCKAGQVYRSSAFMILDSNKSTMASSPLFCNSSRPLMLTATAAWRIGNSAAENTCEGAILSV